MTSCDFSSLKCLARCVPQFGELTAYPSPVNVTGDTDSYGSSFVLWDNLWGSACSSILIRSRPQACPTSHAFRSITRPNVSKYDGRRPRTAANASQLPVRAANYVMWWPFVVPPPPAYAASSRYFPTRSNNDMLSRFTISLSAP